MKCYKCHVELPRGSLYCNICGANQQTPPRGRRRPNGSGSAYKRGRTWTAVVILGWKDVLDKDGNPVKNSRGYIKKTPIPKTKGGFRTEREALAYCPELRKTVAPKRYDGITFSKLYEMWVERHATRVTNDTLNCYKAAYKYYKDIYHMAFADLSTLDWQLCVDDCPQGKRTKQNMKALGTLLYGFADECRVTSENYAKHIYIPRMETESRKPFPKEVVQTILTAAENEVPFADYVATLIFTGHRPTEMLQLELPDYSPEQEIFTGGIKTEAGKNRIVTIPPVIQKFVHRRAQAAKPYMFPKANGTPMDDSYFREECFYPLLRDLKIQPMPNHAEGIKPTYTPYSCRHTYATLMKNVPGADKDKAALMGHTSFEMTFKYQHEDLDSLRNITNNLWPVDTP